MKPSNVLVVLNLHSGKARSDTALAHLIRGLEAYSGRVELLYSASAARLPEQVAQRAEAFDQVICVGGDGTVKGVVTGLLKLPVSLRPPLGILPTGTTCDFAKTLGISKNLKRALNDHLQADIQWVDVGTFNQESFVYVASFGAFSEIAYLTPSSRKRQIGHLAYIIEGLKTLPELTSFEVEIEVDGVAWQGRYLFGAVLNSTSVGGLIRLPQRDVSLDDGAFELLLIEDPRVPLLRPAALARLLTLTNDTLSDAPTLLFLHGKTFKFNFKDASVSWTLDGEYGGTSREALIEVQHRVLPLCRPVRARRD